MALTPGTRLGPYEVTVAIGEGGMGQVYRARDTKLDRDVAVKVLPDSLANDPDRLARFQREAKTLAALNHPNIAHIHGLEESNGVRALVMELVEGEDLSQRLARGAIPIEEALPIAKQIADAIEAAHEQGIIHRDLKPANIKVRPDGTVKVLDFGLAKAMEPSSVMAPNVSQSPTITTPAITAAGMIVGTAAYMSPEQAAGKLVDKRTDIWSFGVIVWETLTGQRLFSGETVSETLADVLRAEIDFNKLPADTPLAVRDLLQRCLDRHTKTRLRDIGEARVTLQKELLGVPGDRRGGRADSSQAAGGWSWLTAVASGVAMVAVACAAALAFVHFRERPQATEPVRFQILPPEQTTFANTAVLSPDGRRLVFEGPGSDGRMLLWVRALDSLVARPLLGTEGAAPGPFWSPDSRFLGFGVTGFPGRLKKVDASGGPPQTLCEYSGGFTGGTWNRQGVILFGAGPNGLARVSDAGSTSSVVTRVDVSRQEAQHAGPVFLPDGRHFLYLRASRTVDNHGVYLGTLDAKPEEQSTKRLLAADADPVFVPSRNSHGGAVLFLRQGALMTQFFDGQSELTGDAVQVAPDVGSTGSYGWFSASDTGGLAFRSGLGLRNELVWFDRQGTRVGQVGSPQDYGGSGLQLSPDGKRVVLAITEVLANGHPGAQRAWTADVSRGIFSRLNSGDGTESSPALSPDGRVAFSSTVNGAVGDLYWMPAGGVGSPEPLLVKSPTVKHPNNFSHDGRFLIYDDHTAQRQDLWILPISAHPGDERKPIPFLVTQADETFGQFSPNGKWVAYSSDESGRTEVYVQGFQPDHVPASGVGKWRISAAGGDKPRWSRDGTELSYVAPDRKMMAVPVKTEPVFEPGEAIALFETKLTGFFPYDVSADGRFLLNTVSDTAASTSLPVTIVLNWMAGLKP